MKNVFFGILIIALLSSCASHVGVMTGNASISDANFNVVGLAVGSAKTQHIMGIGGLGKDALILEAKRNLYLNYPLKKGQALANVTVDIKRSAFPFVFKTMATVSADVIDFNALPSDSSFIAFKNSISSKEMESSFMPNESVIITIKNDIYKARILKTDDAKSTVLFENAKGCFKIKHFNNKKLFSSNSIESELYKVGDGITFSYNSKNYPGVIEAIQEDYLLVTAFLSRDQKKLMRVNINDIIN